MKYHTCAHTGLLALKEPSGAPTKSWNALLVKTVQNPILRKKANYRAFFTLKDFQDCPLQNRCGMKPQKKSNFVMISEQTVQEQFAARVFTFRIPETSKNPQRSGRQPFRSSTQTPR